MTPSRDHDLSDLELARMIAGVQVDPAWASATPDEQLAEVVHRLGENAAATFADARAALVADMEDHLLKLIDDAVPDQ